MTNNEYKKNISNATLDLKLREETISLNQFHSLWSKWILEDKTLNDKFDFEQSPEFRDNIKNLSINEYKYILSLFMRKKRFELNKKLMELGLKSRMDLDLDEQANYLFNNN